MTRLRDHLHQSISGQNYHTRLFLQKVQGGAFLYVTSEVGHRAKCVCNEPAIRLHFRGT